MKIIQTLYKKYEHMMETFIFPLLLLLYPLMKIHQGVDVSDSTYSLGNYLFFDNMEGGMWVISTYLSNVFGAILVKLPGGETLAGMNLYTGLLVSILVLICYYILKKQWNPLIVFWGEILAVSFCWIPTVILYNYLTYLFFAVGAFLLYIGLTHRKSGFLFGAGIVLGMSVMVRFPNLTQAALIVAVWYASAIEKKEDSCKQNKWIDGLKKTGICFCGYIVGFIIPFLTVIVRYGFSAYTNMLNSLTGVQQADETYSAFYMITSVLDAYIRSFKWVGLILFGILLGGALFYIKKGKYELPKKMLYLCGIALLLRFFWGRGMFSFRYYEDYSSMFEWGMAFLYLTLFAGIYVLCSKRTSDKERIYAVIVLIIVCVTPLGSNNYTCQNLNNLFVTAPFTLAVIIKWLQGCKNKFYTFPVWAMLTVILFMITVQSIGFHSVFVFRDGMRGEKRDTRISGTDTIDGMYTNSSNAEGLSGLISYCDENKLIGQEAVFYGDAPGLSFILQMPAAISTSWPDLDSYAIDSFVSELQESESSVIIMRNIKPATENAEKKLTLLNQYLKDEKYTDTYSNDVYTVFVK